MLDSSGGSAPPFDKEAYKHLYSRANSTSRGYSHDLVEHSLDHLLKNPHRKASGKALAEQLYRTARKTLRNRPRLANLDTFREAEGTEPHDFRHAVAWDRKTASDAANNLWVAFDELPEPLRAVLAAKARGLNPDQVQAEVGIGDRQFRNRVASAETAALAKVPGVADARTALHGLFQAAPGDAAEIFHWGLVARGLA